MRTITMSHLLPAVTASAVSGFADFALSASLLRGASLGGLAGIVYSATHHILNKTFEIESGFGKHSVAVITSALLTYGIASAAAAVGLIAMPSLAAFAALFAAAITVDAIFRMIVAGNTNNDKKDVSAPHPSGKNVQKEAEIKPPEALKADPVALRVPTQPLAGAGSNAPILPLPPQPLKNPAAALPQAVGTRGAQPAATKPNVPPVQPPQPALQAAPLPATAPAAKQPGGPSADELARQEATIRSAKVPLISALDAGRDDLVNALLDSGADVNSEDNEKQTPLSMAVKKGKEQFVQRLIQMGAKQDCVDKYQNILLHHAACSGSLDLVKRFQTKANLEAANKWGYTPFAIALSRGYKGVVEHLIQAGAKQDVKIHNGDTALHLAVAGGHNDLIKMVMTDARAKAVNDSGASPWMDAIRENKIEIAKVLIPLSNVNDRMKNNKTPLHIAAEKSDVDGVNWVYGLRKKTLEYHDNKGNTPLLLALLGKKPLNAVKLLELGAKGDCKNKAGETPFSLATAKGYADVLQVLATKGITQ